MSLGRFMGYVIVALVILGILAGVALKQKWIKDEKLAETIRRGHPLFGYVAILVAFAHAIYNFSLFGPNVFGAMTFVTLVTQAVVGKLSTKAGAKPIFGVLHAVIPIFFLVFVLLHIFA